VHYFLHAWNLTDPLARDRRGHLLEGPAPGSDAEEILRDTFDSDGPILAPSCINFTVVRVQVDPPEGMSYPHESQTKSRERVGGLVKRWMLEARQKPIPSLDAYYDAAVMMRYDHGHFSFPFEQVENNTVYARRHGQKPASGVIIKVTGLECDHSDWVGDGLLIGKPSALLRATSDMHQHYAFSSGGKQSLMKTGGTAEIMLGHYIQAVQQITVKHLQCLAERDFNGFACAIFYGWLHVGCWPQLERRSVYGFSGR